MDVLDRKLDSSQAEMLWQACAPALIRFLIREVHARDNPEASRMFVEFVAAMRKRGPLPAELGRFLDSQLEEGVSAGSLDEALARASAPRTR